MFKILVAHRDTKEVIQTYKFKTKMGAILTRIDIMTEWIRMCKLPVVVSSVLPK